MFDRDILRNLVLIEEREIYENNFISIDDIIKSDEMDYYTCPKYEEHFLETFDINEVEVVELDLEFDFEDYYIQLRDEQLIEQRQAYEAAYFSQIGEYDELDFQIDEYDALDFQIESYYEDDYIDFDYYCEYDYYDCFRGNDIDEHDYMEASYCGGHFLDYIPNNDIFDSLDGCDYPEGPDENLNGIKFPDEFFCIPDEYFECPDPCLDFPEDFYYFPEPEYCIEDIAVDLYENEEYHMQKLIDQHIEEEKKFLEFIAKGEISDAYYPPEVLEDSIILLN